jgi:demethylsterigmatocystin 6-O-methyltransferase
MYNQLTDVGAKYYYLRQILHDHADDKCLEILENVVEAMTDDSVLLIDEIVVPDKNADWYVTQTDLAMLAQFSSIERTEGHLRRLLTEAALNVSGITVYTYGFQLSVIECMKARSD